MLVRGWEGTIEEQSTQARERESVIFNGGRPRLRLWCIIARLLYAHCDQMLWFLINLSKLSITLDTTDVSLQIICYSVFILLIINIHVFSFSLSLCRALIKHIRLGNRRTVAALSDCSWHGDDTLQRWVWARWAMDESFRFISIVKDGPTINHWILPKRGILNSCKCMLHPEGDKTDFIKFIYSWSGSLAEAM